MTKQKIWDKLSELSVNLHTNKLQTSVLYAFGAYDYNPPIYT